MKRIFKIIVIILISVFSFYYTEKIIDLSKRNDPIMKKIINNSSSKEIEPVNGIIEDSSLIVGSSGKKVDRETSYEKMKKVKQYNESLFEYINIKPNISKKDNLDKVIIGANRDSKKLAFVFKTDDYSLIKQIVYILDQNDVKATFFIDGKVIEDNLLDVKKVLGKNTLGIYSYNNIFNSISTKYMKNILSKSFNYSNYCLYKNDKFLNACKYYKINTIKPETIQKSPYNYLKNNKKNGLIYEIKVNPNNIKQLNSSLLYLKEKGYNIVTIDELLKE